MHPIQGGGGEGSSDTPSRFMLWKPGKIRLYGPLLGSSTDFTNPVAIKNKKIKQKKLNTLL